MIPNIWLMGPNGHIHCGQNEAGNDDEAQEFAFGQVICSLELCLQ